MGPKTFWVAMIILAAFGALAMAKGNAAQTDFGYQNWAAEKEAFSGSSRVVSIKKEVMVSMRRKLPRYAAEPDSWAFKQVPAVLTDYDCGDITCTADVQKVSVCFTVNCGECIIADGAESGGCGPRPSPPDVAESIALPDENEPIVPPDETDTESFDTIVGDPDDPDLTEGIESDYEFEDST